MAQGTGIDVRENAAARKAKQKASLKTQADGPQGMDFDPDTMKPFQERPAPNKATRGMSFAQKFAAERAKQGKGGTFDWNGKSYTTDRADDVEASEQGDADDAPGRGPPGGGMRGARTGPATEDVNSVTDKFGPQDDRRRGIGGGQVVPASASRTPPPPTQAVAPASQTLMAPPEPVSPLEQGTLGRILMPFLRNFQMDSGGPGGIGSRMPGNAIAQPPASTDNAGLGPVGTAAAIGLPAAAAVGGGMAFRSRPPAAPPPAPSAFAAQTAADLDLAQNKSSFARAVENAGQPYSDPNAAWFNQAMDKVAGGPVDYSNEPPRPMAPREGGEGLAAKVDQLEGAVDSARGLTPEDSAALDVLRSGKRDPKVLKQLMKDQRIDKSIRQLIKSIL